MPITFSCAGCGKKIKAPDKAAGKRSKCPKCNENITIPALDPSQSSGSTALQPIVQPLVRVATASPPAVVTMDCPFCLAEIPAAALKCKHCGETVNAAMRAAEEAQRTPKRDRVRDRDEDDYDRPRRRRDRDEDDRPRRRRDRDDSREATAVSVAQNTTVHVHGPKHGFPHVLHLLLTLITCGLWFPIWALHYLIRDRSFYY